MSKKKKGKKGRKEAFDPEKDTGILRPVDMTIAAGEINDRYSDYPSRGLNPVKLASILRAADEGNVRSQMELFEEMEEKDAHLFSQMQTRKLAVTGLDWEVQPFSPDDERDKAIAEWIKDQLLGIENLDDILTDLLDAIGKGVSIMEIIWGVDSDGFDVIEDIRYVHQKKLVWDWETDDMLVCTEQFPNGIHLPKNKFVVHRYKAKSGHPSRAGIMRIVSWMYLFKKRHDKRRDKRRKDHEPVNRYAVIDRHCRHCRRTEDHARHDHCDLCRNAFLQSRDLFEYLGHYGHQERHNPHKHDQLARQGVQGVNIYAVD